MDHVDLIVVGGGAGGLTAAREGVRRGARTVLINEGAPGGDCTFTGCIPSKTLLAAAERGDSYSSATAAVAATVRRVAATEDASALEREGVQVVDARGRFTDARTIDAGAHSFRAPRIVIATGSRAALPPIAGIADAGVLTNETLFALAEQPEHLAILGGGPIGCEMVQAFSRLGTQVTVFEREPFLLPRDEPDAGAIVAAVLQRDGVDVRTTTSVSTVTRLAGSNRLQLGTDDGRSTVAGQVLVATGRAPVTTGLDPDRAGLELESNGAIRVDETMATGVAGIWAIGDVTGRMQFTHAAAQMAIIATANAFASPMRPRRRFDRSTVPTVTYVDPEVAHVGMSERDASRHGGRVALIPLGEVDRALTSGQTDGFVKLIAGPRRVLGNLGGGRLLGATIVAPRAGEMIHEVVLAMRTNMFTGRLAQTVHAYPSWSMAIQEAAAQFFYEHRGRVARPANASGPTAVTGTAVPRTEPAR